MCLSEEGIIITFFYSLQNIALVAQNIGRPWTKVMSILVWACECQLLKDFPCLIHTLILSGQQHHTIIQAAKSNQKIPRCTCRGQYAPSGSVYTDNSLWHVV